MNHWMECNDMDYMFALMRPLKYANFGQLDLDNSPIELHLAPMSRLSCDLLLSLVTKLIIRWSTIL